MRGMGQPGFPGWQLLSTRGRTVREHGGGPDAEDPGPSASLPHPFFPEEAESMTWRDSLDLADAALRLAKRAGRNRSVGLVPGPRFGDDPRKAKARVDADLERAVTEGLVAADTRGGEP